MSRVLEHLRRHPTAREAGAFGIGATLAVVLTATVAAAQGSAMDAGAPELTAVSGAPEQEPFTARSSEPLAPSEDAAPGGGPSEEEAPTAAATSAVRAQPIEGLDPLSCPKATVSVGSAEELQDALDAARPGASIALADGVYQGLFVASVDGTQEQPIFLCGSPDAVLDGGGPKSSDAERVGGRSGEDAGKYALHLDGVSSWRLVGFAVRNSQKGVMADGTTDSVIHGLTVSDTGDEAIHLRNTSTDNVVEGNTIRRTGLRKPKYGEGVYIGTAESNWDADTSRTDGEPDASDRNVIRYNDIAETTSEAIDVKEGTSDGEIAYNRFDGSSLEGDADSWVDVKGNAWQIHHNEGASSPVDGFQTHEILDGWGTDNVFSANLADVDGEGFGFAFRPDRGNVVTCDNEVSGAAEGLANIPCT